MRSRRSPRRVVVPVTVNERKRSALSRQNPAPGNFSNKTAQVRIYGAAVSPRKERAMRRLWSLLTALVLLVGPVAAGDDENHHDRKAGICVGGLNLKACVPPEEA